ncbi:MAG TPA: TonB-dependent receptor [Blastocatellia bacterium]|nr:TonB-dependent receptor [Blastocatellia bacterium]
MQAIRTFMAGTVGLTGALACRFFSRRLGALAVLFIFAASSTSGVLPALGQSLGTAGTVAGTITDPSGAVISSATVTLENRTTGYTRTVTTDQTGAFRFDNVPPNRYSLSVSANGFSPAQQIIDVRSSVPMNLGKIALAVSGTSASVEINAGEALIENVPSSHVDVDQSRIEKMPIRTPGNGLSDVVTQSAPGVAADSNGFFHPLGDHAESSISLDNQPITDQQSKAFSTQIPVNAIQSLEVVTGSVPAEFGDKASLVINAITRSGLGLNKPTGSLSALYGSFGSTQEEATFGFGGAKAGNFAAFNFERSGRFLDPPEPTPLHDEGKTFGIFDRLDYNPTASDALHLNLYFVRNFFQVPNTFDQEALGQNQRQLVHSINIAPGYVHTFNQSTLLTINPFYRLDTVKYFPSADPFSDETQTIAQSRRLNNIGVKADVAYNHGIHNAKVGVQIQHTLLTEGFQFGITDPGFNDPTSPDFIPDLLPFDLTRGGNLFTFHGHADIKQEAVYAQDLITLRNLALNLGLRYDNYDGISHGNLLQPRLGVSYNIKATNTVLRGSYTRHFETPYNENLVLSSATGANGLANGILGEAISEPLKPGRRNQFNVGIQQSLGRYFVIDGDYFWKYTRNAYDFNVILNTPITFPISWDKSKIDGVAVRLTLANYKGLSAYFTAGHTRARYFPPETGGLFFNSDLPAGVFRIDHDQAFQQTTQVQYQFHQFKRLMPYVAFSWRYDSGLVAGSVPDFATALTLTPDQQAQIGLFCGSVFATPTAGLTDCTDANRGATRVRIPADGTEDDDHNPPRIAPRHLFDLSVGTDNLFRTERTKVTLRLTAANLTNKVALYNFLSTFSGTHFVPPRAFQAQMGITF